MVRGRKKSSTEEETVAPSRRSGRARTKVSYNDADDDIPQEILEASIADADNDYEDPPKPKRGRKKSAAGIKTPAKKRGRRASKPVIEEQPVADVVTEEQGNSEVPSIPESKPEVASTEGCPSTEESNGGNATEEEKENEKDEEVNEAKINPSTQLSKLETIPEKEINQEMDESPKPSDKLSEIKDNDQSKDDTNMEQQEAQKEEDQLPDFEEEESDKEEFEMIQKSDIPTEAHVNNEVKETETSKESKTQESVPQIEETVEDEKADNDNEEEEQDPDMLQLDANVDEDIELNKVPETVINKEEEDKKKEERKRRWKDDEKEKSPVPKRRHSIKKSDTREPSPPPGEPSEVVHITNLVRPFTLSQLQDFLRVHGEFSDFWIDKIKSNCILKYDSVESAINCRKIIHGKKWPKSNPKSLRVMYTTTEKLESAKSGNLTGSVSSKETIRREKKRSLSRSPNRGTMRSDKEFTKEKAVASSDESEDEDEGPDIQLDDLFKKTKTTPALYWSPLSDAQVQARDEAREERRKQREQRRKESEERRMTEKTDRKKSGDHSRRSRSRSKRRSRSRS